MWVLVPLLFIVAVYASPVCENFECDDEVTCLKLMYQCLNANQVKQTNELFVKVDRLINLLIMGAVVSISALVYKLAKDAGKYRQLPLRLISATILWIAGLVYACVHSRPPDEQVCVFERNASNYNSVDAVAEDTPM